MRPSLSPHEPVPPTTTINARPYPHTRFIAAEREATDAEGSRIQRAVQQQEEQDSLKTIELLRQMDASFRAEVEAARTAAEKETCIFMKQEVRRRTHAARSGASSNVHTRTHTALWRRPPPPRS